MNGDQFKRYLALYGADFERWPEDIRPEAQELSKSSPEFQRILVEEQEFEAVLRAGSWEPPSSDLAERIITLAKDQPQRLTLGRWISDLWKPKPAFALAFVLVMGFAVGYFSNTYSQSAEQEIELASLLYENGDMSWVTNSN